MRNPTVPLLRSLALLSGAAGLLVLAGCMERHPVDPSGVAPAFSTAAAPLSAWGTASIDGSVTAGEWAGAAVIGPFTASVPGGKTAQVTFRVMNDAEWMYFLVEYDRPVSDPNSVVRLEFRHGTAIDDIWFSSGSPLDRFSTHDGATFQLDTSVPGGTSDVEGVRRNSGGRTVYEFAKRRLGADAPDIQHKRDVQFGVDAPVSFTLQLIPGGSATTTTRTGQIEAAEFNDPAIPDIIAVVSGAYCQVDVTAKRVDLGVDGPLLVKRAVPRPAPSTDCIVRFIDVPVHSEWVISGRNTVLGSAELWDIWPNPFSDNVPTSSSLPRQQGAVWIDVENVSRPLTEDNYNTAWENAQPMVVDRTVRLELTEGRTVSCEQGSDVDVFVYSASLLTHPRFQSVRPSAHLGHFVARAKTGDCVLQLARGVETFVEAINSSGQIYRALIGEDDATVVLDAPDPDFAAADVVNDGWGDASPLDIGFVVYGLAAEDPNHFLIKASVRGLDQDNISRYEFELTYGPDGSTTPTQALKVTMSCNERGSGTCRISVISPAHQAPRVRSASGSVDPFTGNGHVMVRLDFTNVNVADLRVRSLDPGKNHDFAPNDVGETRFRRWERGDGSNSMRIF